MTSPLSPLVYQTKETKPYEIMPCPGRRFDGLPCFDGCAGCLSTDDEYDGLQQHSPGDYGCNADLDILGDYATILDSHTIADADFMRPVVTIDLIRSDDNFTRGSQPVTVYAVCAEVEESRHASLFTTEQQAREAYQLLVTDASEAYPQPELIRTFNTTHAAVLEGFLTAHGVTSADLDSFVDEALEDALEEAVEEDVLNDPSDTAAGASPEGYVEEEQTRRRAAAVAALHAQGMSAQLMVLLEGWRLGDAASAAADIAAYVTGRLDIYPPRLT